MNSIKDFLDQKAQGKMPTDFEAYPIEFVFDGEYKKGFLQDVTTSVRTLRTGQEQHKLIVIILDDFNNDGIANGGGIGYKKVCTAPVGCKLEWDNLHCALTLV